MAKSEYDKIEEQRSKSMLAEPDMIAKDTTPNKKISNLEAKQLQQKVYGKLIESDQIDEYLKGAVGFYVDMFLAGAPEKVLKKERKILDKRIADNPETKGTNPALVERLISEIYQERIKNADGGLVGGQKELDKNNDGDITGEDFAMLREGKQEGGMLMDDQMTDMMQTEETPDMENQMADMMPPVAETTEEELQEQQEIEESQVPDEMMENNYVDFLIDEALDENEEAMLMEELQANPQLSMIFDKVMEVAMEFSGSGSVEGPGSEVSDSIPARLSDGEFVFTAKAVDEIGADNLMSMMKDAEAQADQRLPAQDGGAIREEQQHQEFQQPQETTQNIRVTKETVDPTAMVQEEEDLVGKEIRSQMMLDPYQRHVRS